jgi:hypothetical protein
MLVPAALRFGRVRIVHPGRKLGPDGLGLHWPLLDADVVPRIPWPHSAEASDPTKERSCE